MPGCARPAGSATATVCATCGRILTRHLVDVDWLVDELETSYTRQTRYGGGSGGARSSSSSTPLLYDDRASKALTRLTAALAGAVVDLQASRTSGWLPPRPGPVGAARWIKARVHDLRHLEGGNDHAFAIISAVKAARRAVDRPNDGWYAGPCNADAPGGGECGVDLYAEEGATFVHCARCSAEYTVSIRREWLREAAQDEWVDAPALSRAVSWLGGQPLAQERIRKWKQRRRIVTIPRRCAHCHEQPVVRPCPMDTPLYRVGDALALVAAEADRQAKHATNSPKVACSP